MIVDRDASSDNDANTENGEQPKKSEIEIVRNHLLHMRYSHMVGGYQPFAASIRSTAVHQELLTIIQTQDERIQSQNQ